MGESSKAERSNHHKDDYRRENPDSPMFNHTNGKYNSRKDKELKLAVINTY